MIVNRAANKRKYGIRAIRHDDRSQLLSGVHKLSPTTRYRRFNSARKSFSKHELDHLTSCDGWNHIALIAASIGSDGQEKSGIAVGRFYRDRSNPKWGEVAIVVTDSWHGQGVGTSLLRELSALCRQVGVEGWRASIMIDNQPALRLFAKVGRVIQYDTDENHVTLHIELPYG